MTSTICLVTQTLAVYGQSLTVTHSSTPIGRPTERRIYRENRRRHAPPNRSCFLTKLDKRTKLESPNPNQHTDGIQKQHAPTDGQRHRGGALFDRFPRPSVTAAAQRAERVVVLRRSKLRATVETLATEQIRRRPEAAFDTGWVGGGSNWSPVHGRNICSDFRADHNESLLIEDQTVSIVSPPDDEMLLGAAGEKRSQNSDRAWLSIRLIKRIRLCCLQTHRNLLSVRNINIYSLLS